MDLLNLLGLVLVLLVAVALVLVRVLVRRLSRAGVPTQAAPVALVGVEPPAPVATVDVESQAPAPDAQPAVEAVETPPAPQPDRVQDGDPGLPVDPTGTAPERDLREDARDRLAHLRRHVEGEDERIQRPEDLLALPAFEDGVAIMAGPHVTARELVEHLGSSGYVLPSMAARALPARDDVMPTDALQATASFGGYPLRFVLDWLQARGDAQTLPLMLRHAREWWWESLGVRQRVRDYLQWAQVQLPSTLRVALDEIEEPVLGEVRDVLKRFRDPATEAFLSQLEDELALRRERRVLGAFGRVLTAPAPTGFMHPTLERTVIRLFDRLTRERPKSVLLSGEHGVGKTVLADLLAARLHDAGWLVFEASAADVLSGQKFVGELEGRVREMLVVLRRGRAVWRVQDMLDLLTKGSHSQDPRGILDLVLPAIERGDLLIIGELTPRQLSQLLLARPAIKYYFDVVPIAPADPATLGEITAQWQARQAQLHGQPVAEIRLLDEARRVATQFFPEQQEPGRVLRLLDDALRIAIEAEPHGLPLTIEHMLQAVSSRSGLPMTVIDDRQSLDLASVREMLRERVMGQDEAIDALLDRISMLKAGLVDGTRPIGVFLFAGPTGTGKTELAKALGEMLFGSDDRLLRLDMSEFQGEDAVWRLLGSGDERDGARSLTSQIREQPFSVVLLDEFEKAHPKVWDLFLQVFDDGRLTDRSGHVADFRHSIIILTSNVGSTMSRNAGPGFTTVAGGYSRSTVERALFDTFRREFLNRLDRIVLFNPLDRTLMRGILHRELGRVLARRGLRNRGWAVEWEPSAIEFLLDRGFTPDLGARPLSRAIDQHLLSPLARTIVEHKAPAGDQFLFVRSSGSALEVEFIDPDAPPAELALTAPVEGMGSIEPAELRDLIGTAAVPADAPSRLLGALAALRVQVQDGAWTRSAGTDFAAMTANDFWQSPGRHEVLDRIERRDRIQAALAAAGRLADRLVADGVNAAFVSHLAQLLWLLGLAIEAVYEQRPQDAVLSVSVGTGMSPRELAETRPWWQRVVHMYQSWGAQRTMRVDVLRFDVDTCTALIAVSGFGALDVLRSESGLHVLELDRDEEPRHLAVHVAVDADLPGVARSAPADDKRVCRRYREQPTPLVRDSVRGWRNGRVDRVLAGDFDIIDVALGAAIPDS